MISWVEQRRALSDLPKVKRVSVAASCLRERC
jgi:hypothetical protein